MQTKSRSNGRAFSPRHLFSAAIHVCVHASPFLRKYTHHLWSVSPQSQIISCLVHRFQFCLLSLFSPPFISFCCIKSLGCVAIMGRAAPSSLCCRASIQPFHFPLWMHTVKKNYRRRTHPLPGGPHKSQDLTFAQVHAGCSFIEEVHDGLCVTTRVLLCNPPLPLLFSTSFSYHTE